MENRYDPLLYGEGPVVRERKITPKGLRAPSHRVLRRVDDIVRKSLCFRSNKIQLRLQAHPPEGYNLKGKVR
jgi:hypothetical protein